MNPCLQLGAIGLLSCAAAGATYWIKGAPARGFVCDPSTLKANEVCLEQVSMDTPILWVDARSRTAWKESGMSGSVLWNLDPNEDMQVFEAETAVRIIETPQVIVYCGDENCGISHQVAQQIRNLQLGAEVSVLKGGWRALSDAGRIRK